MSAIRTHRSPAPARRALRPLLLAGAVGAALLGPAVAAGPAAATGHAAQATVKTWHDKKLGTILVTTSGLTLYRYTLDKKGRPTCTGVCAKVWPPLLVPKGTKKATGAKGVRDLSVVKAPDGRWQVRYRGIPLYRYEGDRKAGQTHGQGVGGVWFVVRVGASGAAVTTTTTAASGGY